MNGTQGQRVYVFKKGSSQGTKDMKDLLGGKGANLCEMARIGLNVPAGLVITTDVCQEFQDLGKVPDAAWSDVQSGIKEIEDSFGSKFGDPSNPLLLSVRSGAKISMPGMMDTVLNLGLNDELVEGLAAKTTPRFAYDCYRRFIDMFGEVVLGMSHSDFEAELHAVKQEKGYKFDVELTADDLKEIVKRFKQVYVNNGKVLPTEPQEQLIMSIAAVFKSWNTPRAVKYREINKITGLKGTAVNVQAMVYGNFSDNSGTGVCFTRNPATGEKLLFGEFLVCAQGEDVVAGLRTPLPVIEMGKAFPEAYQELLANTTTLEHHMRDMQDCEFTVQDGKLFMLQTRNGKRTGPAALRVAVEMEKEGLVDKTEAVQMVEPRHLDQLLHPIFDHMGTPEYKRDIIGTGLAASPGAGCGRVVFSAEDAEQWRKNGERVILVRIETSPEDVGGMASSEGILTARGGMTSHAAVVARGWGKPCVCGCDALQVDYASNTAQLNGVTLKEGDWISLNGTSGEVLQGKQQTREPQMSDDLALFMEWVDNARELGVFTNCDTPEDAAIARKNGAEGIGLVRTEHMFFSSPERIAAMRRMIAAEELELGDTVEALAALKEFQRADFEGIFEAMDGCPVTIRLLDPPLHEFLPHAGPALDALIETLVQHFQNKAGQHTTSIDKLLRKKLEALNEANPMLGLRGCRLGIVHTDITAMQAAAIIEAAVNVQKRGIVAKPKVMIPLVGFEEELKHQIDIVDRVAAEVFQAAGVDVDYEVGTMIEVPRGALQAGNLAKHAKFFSVGSNDLTQMCLGFSRDDAEAKFMGAYLRAGILERDPFETLDQVGVGELIKTAIQRGRATRPGMVIGLCGEHGGDPKSIEFVATLGITYVSCSPLRVPIARLAAAQAAIKQRSQKHDHCQD